MLPATVQSGIKAILRKRANPAGQLRAAGLWDYRQQHAQAFGIVVGLYPDLWEMAELELPEPAGKAAAS